MANTRVYIVPDSTGAQRSGYPSGNWTNVNAPTGLSATVDGRTIVFQLTDTNSGAAAYVIQRSETSNGTYTDFATGSTGATTITTTGNAPGTFYYRAVGVISAVRSSTSNAVSATVEAPTTGGDLAHGATFTINAPAGVNYGTFNGEILFYLDAETIAVGTGLHGVPATLSTNSRTISLQYGSSGSNQHCRINSNRSSRTNGTRSIFIDWDNPDNSSSGDTIVGFGIASSGFGTRVFVSYKRFMEGNYLSNSEGGSNMNHKDMYIFGNRNGSLNDMPQFLSYIDAGQTSWGTYNNDGGSTPSLYRAFYQQTSTNGNSAPGDATSRLRTYATTRDRWFKRDFFAIMNSAPAVADGTTKIYADGQLVLFRNGNFPHMRGAEYAGGEWADIRIGHMAQGFVSTAQANFDEVYAATTAARVELCTSATADFSQTRNASVQPPISWNNSQITFRVNEGALPSTGSLYAWVYDNDDNLLCIQQVR